jgi:hypothetical protein
LTAIRISIRTVDRNIIVAEDLIACDLERLCLPQHRVVGSLTRLFPFHFGREIRQTEHYFVQRIIQLSFLIIHVEENSNPRINDLLKGIAGLDRLTAQA